MQKLFCGIDIHKDDYVGNIMKEDGTVVREGSFRPIKEEAQSFLNSMPITAIAIEACGMWRGAYNLFTGLGYKVKSDFSTSVSLVAMWKNQGPKKPTRAVGEHATSL